MQLAQSRKVRDANARMGYVERHVVVRKRNSSATVDAPVMAIAASENDWVITVRKRWGSIGLRHNY